VPAWVLIVLGVVAVGLILLSLIELIAASRKRESRPQEAIRPLQRPNVRIRLDGSDDLRVGLRRERPQIVPLEFGIVNPNPAPLVGAGINLLITEQLRRYKCDRQGREEPGGEWHITDGPEPLGDEPPPGTYKEFWGEYRTLMGGGGLHPIWIKLRLTEPGIYYAAGRVWGAGLDGRTNEVAKIVVTETDAPGPRGLIGELIEGGERMLAIPPDPFTGEDPPPDWLAWVIDAKGEIQKNCPELPAPEDSPDWATGPEWKAQTAGIVAVLYECRRRLAP
jgi:hypothetical protein